MTRFDHIISAANAAIAAWEYCGSPSDAIDEYQMDNEITFTDDEWSEAFERAHQAIYR